MPHSVYPESGIKEGDASPRQPRRCEVCGVTSHEKSLVGLKNDRRKDGPRWCVAHHPEFSGRAFDWTAL